MSDRASATWRILAALVVLAVIALAFWGWKAFHKPDLAPDTAHDAAIDASLAAGRAPATIRAAVLYDCYDHARENVPPRNDTSARANHWQPPPMPAQMIRAAAAERLSTTDHELIEFLKKWEAEYLTGKSIVGPQRTELTLLLQSQMPFETLFNLGSAMGFLEGAYVSALFHRAALRRAAEEHKNLSPLHPAAPMLRAALPQMGIYWNSPDYPLLEQRFKIEMQLYPPLSQEGRKCMHSCAEAMYYQGGKSIEAADLIAAKVKLDEQAGDLTASDKQEMGWIVGIFYREDRLKESIAGLTLAAQSGGGRAMQAIQMIQMKILNLPPDQMEQQLADIEKSRLSPEQIQMVQSRVRDYAARRALSSTRPAMTIEQRMQQRREQEAAAARAAATQDATSIEQRLAERRAREAFEARATTRPGTTIEERLAARRAIETGTTRPVTRPATVPALTPQQRQYQAMMEQQRVATVAAADKLIPELRALLKANPRQGVERLLNEGGILLTARRFDEFEEMAIAAIILSARDTWQVERLQRLRVANFRTSGKFKEQLAASRALFNVAGMGSVPFDLRNLTEAFRAAYPTDPGMVNRFRLQQLAGAQPDAGKRQKALADLGDSVMAAIVVDPAPFKDAIAQRQSASDYDTLYSLGNLLLISGRISEAREVFEKVYKIAPPGEVNYASEAIAKVIKAEDGNIGRANQFVAAIRPKE